MIAASGTGQPADLNNALAAERTFLAWIRTGLALMGFGFVVARFGLFLRQLQLIDHAPAARSYGLSVWFGTTLITLGVVVIRDSGHSSFGMASPSACARVGSRRNSVSSPSMQAVLIAVFLVFGRTRNGDLCGFRAGYCQSASRK